MNDRILSDVNATPSNKNPLLVFETMSGFLMQYAILWDVKIDLAQFMWDDMSSCSQAPWNQVVAFWLIHTR